METREIGRAFLRGDVASLPLSSVTPLLGWLQHPRDVTERIREIEGRYLPRHDRTLLLGMGGSASGAGMLAASGPGQLQVVDTSHPDSIQSLEFSGHNVIASSKSGSTIETNVALAHALSHGLDPQDLVIITDPGTALAELGASLGATVFWGDPATGGRFSALSHFGLLPAFASGADVYRLIDAVLTDEEWLDAFEEGFEEALAARREDGVPTVALHGDPLSSFAALWEEQLIAESTGKGGVGLLPIASSRAVPENHGAHVQCTHARVLGMCAAIGVDPFNQPDVEDAKRRTFDELTAATDDVYDEISLIESELEQLRRTIVLEAFAPLSGTSAVAKVRGNLEARGHLVVAGVGPRYLHSTGQLHKGGPTGLYSVHVDVTPAVEPERISGRRFSFHELVRAQSRADAAALRGKGRTVRRLSVASLDELSGLFG